MIHVTTTCPDAPSAERLARAALLERVAACVNIMPGLRSLYHWDGGIAEDDEVLVIFKTAETARAALVAFIEAEHPYDLPVITWEKLETTPEAAAWLDRETR